MLSRVPKIWAAQQRRPADNESKSRSRKLERFFLPVNVTVETFAFAEVAMGMPDISKEHYFIFAGESKYASLTSENGMFGEFFAKETK